MAQTRQLVDALKRSLKAHGKTYADVAAALGLTEASVKRLFSEHSLSLKRLDQICAMMDLEISDLVQQLGEAARPLTRLSERQEREIAGDVMLLLVATCVLSRWSFEEILAEYALEETQLVGYLARLDRLGLIELLPKNRIKRRVAPNFQWLPNGPIQQFYQARVEKEFFSTRFSRDTERLIVVNGMLADSSNAVFQRKLQRLAAEFDAQVEDDARLPLEQRHGTTAVLAIRRWEYPPFARLKRRRQGESGGGT